MCGRLAPALLLLAVCGSLPAHESAPNGKRLFEGYCGACHSLELPMSQRLDRNNWAWVLDDMTTKFGCPISEADKKVILDYLVKNYGPNR